MQIHTFILRQQMSGFSLVVQSMFGLLRRLLRFLEGSCYLLFNEHGFDWIQMLPTIHPCGFPKTDLSVTEILQVAYYVTLKSSSKFLLLCSVAFLVTLLPNSSFHLWLGLTSDSQGHFKWAEPGLLSYTNWGPGEPVNNSGQNKNPVWNKILLSHTEISFPLHIVPIN